MTDFKSELREILDDAFQRGFHFCDDERTGECWQNDEAYKSLDDIIALFISKGWVQVPTVELEHDKNNQRPTLYTVMGKEVMTGQEWYNKFMKELTGSKEPQQGINFVFSQSRIIDAAKFASGIKGEIE